MPFDALTGLSPSLTLAEALDAHGIVPVGWDKLAAHKQAQLAAFQPGFWQRHEAWLPIALVGSIGCMAVSGGLSGRIAAGASLLSWSPTLIWLGCFTLLIVFGVFRGRAGASWQERTVQVEALAALGVPEGIAGPARALCRSVDGAELILGELVEEAVVLDPYLILVCNDQMVCLGIWDEARVIASAH